MASARAEHLLILNQACKGLLCRTHWMTHFKTPQSLETKDLTQVLKFLKKGFPKIQSQEIKQVKGYDLFQGRSERICTELQDWYFTITDVVAFNAKAEEVLINAGNDITKLRSCNYRFMALFMELLAGYVKLQLAMQMVANKPTLIVAYILAFEVVQGKRDDHLQSILSYMSAYMGNQDLALPARLLATINTIREKCDPISRVVAETTKFLGGAIQRWADPQSFEKKEIFGILYDAGNIVQPARTDRYLELEYLNSFREWVNYALLVCPSTLQEQDSRICLQKILSHSFSLQVFRELSFAPALAWDKTFNDFKCGHKSQGNKFYLKTHREAIFKDAYTRGNECALNHRSLRRYLQVQLRQYICLFTEIPGLAAPKFQLVLALLKLASDEIHWYFRHTTAEPYKAKKQSWLPSLARDKNIVKLIAACCDLCKLVSTHANLVKEYFVEYVRDVDSPACETALKKFLDYIGGQIPKNQQNLMMKLLNTARNVSLETNFTAFKIDFYRVTSWLTSKTNGIAFDTTKPILAVFNEIFTHVCNILQVEQQLVEKANLGGLVWYEEELKQVQNWTLKEPELYGYAMSLAHVLGHVKYDMDLKFCPDEQASLIKNTMRSGELLMDEICRTVLRNLNTMYKTTMDLNSSTGIEAQLKKVQLLRQKGRQSAQPAATAGSESKYGARAYWTNQERAHNLGMLLTSIRNTKQFQVFKLVVNTYDWLYEALDKHVYKLMESLFLVQGSPLLIGRPSVALRRLQALQRSLSYVEQHLAINSDDLIRGNVLKHFTKLSAGMVGEDLTLDGKGSTVIQKVGKFYWDLISKPNVTFSPLKMHFSTSNNHKRRDVQAEDYTSYPELRALCQLIGPYGVKAVQSVILNNVGQLMMQMKRILGENSVYLGQLDFVDLKSWWGNVVKVQNKDEFLKATVQLGRHLQFISLLKAAQRSVQHDYVPFISQIVELVMYRIENDSKILPSKQLCNILVDSGVEDPMYDFGIKSVFKKVFTGKEGLSHFPKMFACLFFSDTWKQSRFSPDSEGFNTGVECAITAIQTIIPAICSTEPATLAMLKKFVILSAYSLLHMNSKVEARDKEMRDFHIPSMMVFMSKFMETCKGLSMHVLEECLPFTLMRTKIIEIYEKIQNGSEVK